MRRLLALLLVLAGCGPTPPELKLLTWSEYVPPEAIAAFEKETGCRVRLDYIESSDTLRAKLDGGASGYDVVMPSDEVVPGLVARGLLEALDAAQLPNLKNIDVRYRGLAFDPKDAHTVPFTFGTTGIAYRTDKVTSAPDSWAALWDPGVSGKVALLDDAREVLAAVQRLDGSLEKGSKRFEGWAPLTWESNPKTLLVNGDAWIAQAFSGDGLQAAHDSGGKVAYVIPKEGGTLWFDTLAVAKGAPQRALAHRFIDFLLRPEVSARITNEKRFGNPNRAALELVDPELRKDPRVFPTEDVLRRLSPLAPLDPAGRKHLDEAWARIRAR